MQEVCASEGNVSSVSINIEGEFRGGSGAQPQIIYSCSHDSQSFQ